MYYKNIATCDITVNISFITMTHLGDCEVLAVVHCVISLQLTSKPNSFVVHIFL